MKTRIVYLIILELLSIIMYSQTVITTTISRQMILKKNIYYDKNIMLAIIDSGSFFVSYGDTLLIEGTIQAPLRQIFYGNGTINMVKAATHEIYPEWFGAKGDGISDDAVPVQKAVSQKGKLVRLSDRIYRIGSAIKLADNVVVEGTLSSPFMYVINKSFDRMGSWIYTTVGTGNISALPTILLSDNDKISRIGFYYPEQISPDATSGNVVEYSPTIGTGNNIVNSPIIENCLFLNSFIAIDLFGAQRPILMDLGIGAFLKAVVLDYCLDVPNLFQIHIWPFYQPNGAPNKLRQYSEKNLIGFSFGRVDGLEANQLFVFGAKKGFYFYAGYENGTCWGKIDNFDLDQIDIPIDIASGSTYQTSISNGMIVIGNSQSDKYINKAVNVNGSGQTSFNNIRFVELNGKHARNIYSIENGFVHISNNYLWGCGTDSDLNPAKQISISGGFVNINNTFLRSKTEGKTFGIFIDGGRVLINSIQTFYLDEDIRISGGEAFICGSYLNSANISINDTSNGNLILGDNFLSGKVITHQNSLLTNKNTIKNLLKDGINIIKLSGDTAYLLDNSIMKVSRTGTLEHPPFNLLPNEIWKDTSDSQIHPILRINE